VSNGGSVYALAGGKGGVGKTTVVANVAVALAEKGFDVAAVDADLGMTNLASFLQVEADGGIHAVLAGEAALADVTVEGPAGVTVVPGGDELRVEGNPDPAELRSVVDPVSDRADVVVLDTGAGISHQNLVAYGLADAVALVTTAEELAVGDADKTARLAAKVHSPVLGTVLTRVDAATDLEPLVDRLDRAVIAAVPEYERPDPSEPVAFEASESSAAAEYDRLATTFAVCHRTRDLESAAREASEAVTLPARGESRGAGSRSILDGLLARLPLRR